MGRINKNGGEKLMKKRMIFVLVALMIVNLIYLIGSGFRVREDVCLIDYIVPPYQDEMTIVVGVASSAGYTRAVKNVSDNPEKMQLQFYSAYGGINGSIGEQHRFVIDVPPECKEIYFARHGTFELMLYRDEKSGAWNREG